MALSRAPAVALLVASTYGVALVVAAFVVPVYESDGSSSSGETTQASDSLAGSTG